MNPAFVRALLAVALVIAPLGGSAAEPYEIDVVLPVTGPGAFVAHVEINALTVIEQTTNRAGGIRGRPIKFVVQDDQSDPAVSVQLVNGLIARKAPFVLGSTLAATCNATAALLGDGPVQYCFSPGVHPAPGSYQYSAGVDTSALLAAAIRYLKLGFDATPARIRTYIDGLHGWLGINGTYDFRAYPQRGIGLDAVIVLRWDPATETGIALSRPGGGQ